MIRRAHAHRGTAFVEILQNCNIFNDGAFADLTERERKAETQLVLEHGKPLVFGKNRDNGHPARQRPTVPEVVMLGDGVGESDLLVHDERDPTLAYFLSRMQPPDFLTPIGVFRQVARATYEDAMAHSVQPGPAPPPDERRPRGAPQPRRHLGSVVAPQCRDLAFHLAPYRQDLAFHGLELRGDARSLHRLLHGLVDVGEPCRRGSRPLRGCE